MLQDKAAALKQDEREGGRSRRWRGQLVKLNHLVSLLEADQEELEKVFPQVPPPSPPPLPCARARGMGCKQAQAPRMDSALQDTRLRQSIR